MKSLREAKRYAQMKFYGKSELKPEKKIRHKGRPRLPVEKKEHPLVAARRTAGEIGLEPDQPVRQPRDGMGAEGHRGAVYFFNAEMAPWVKRGYGHKVKKRVIELIRIHGHAHVEELIEKSSLSYEIMRIVGDLF